MIPFPTNAAWNLVKVDAWESQCGALKFQNASFRMPMQTALENALRLCKKHALYLAVKIEDDAIIDFDVPLVGIPDYWKDPTRPEWIAITISGECAVFFAKADSQVAIALKHPDGIRKYAALRISKIGRTVLDVGWVAESTCSAESQRVQQPDLAMIFPVPHEAALQMFEKLNDWKDIPFDFPSRGCEYRAHESCRRLRAEFKESPDAICKLYLPAPQYNMIVVKTCNDPDGKCIWRHHVAPAVYTKVAGFNRIMALDPALFPCPTSADEWVRAFTLTQNRPEDTLQSHVLPTEAFCPANCRQWTRDSEYTCTETQLEILRGERKKRNDSCPPPYC